MASISAAGGAPPRFTIRAHDEWLHVEGSLFVGDFTLAHNKRPIVQVRLASVISNQYFAEIADGEDTVAMLALTLMCELLFAAS